LLLLTPVKVLYRDAAKRYRAFMLIVAR
jgi:hypothetical protein